MNNGLFLVPFDAACWPRGEKRRIQWWRRWLGASLLSAALTQTWGADLFWRVDGTSAAITAASWSATDSAPYTTAWANGSSITFGADSTIQYVTGVPVGNITLDDGIDVNWVKAGTFTTGGAVRTVAIGAGSTLIWNGQTISGAVGTGFIKEGAGTWDLGSISTSYAGGFTLNAGTVIVGGLNSLGNGALTLNGGVIAPNSSVAKDLSGKFTTLTLGGDVQLGDALNLRAGSGDLIFSAPVSLGAGSRRLRIGADGLYSFTGNISGGAGAGLVIAAAEGVSGAVVLSGANSYSGPTVVEGGALRLNSSGAVPSGSNLQLAGGVLELGTAPAWSFTLGTATGQMQWTGDGGFAAVSADRSVTLNSGGTVVWGSGSFVPDGKRLLFSTAKSTRIVTLTNDIDLGSEIRSIRVAVAAGPFGSPTAVLSGKLSGSGGLMISGGGSLALTGTSDYAGGTTLMEGTLTVGSNSALGTGPLFLGTSSSGTPSMLTGNGTAVTLANDIALQPGGGGLYQLGGVAESAMTLDGVISGIGAGISHTGVNVLTLNGDNTFTGIADLRRGTVVIGHDRALGLGTVQFSGATIQGDGTARTLANAGSFAPFTIAGSSDLTFAGKLENSFTQPGTTITVTNTGKTTFGAIDLSETSASRRVTFAAGAGAQVVVTGVVSNGALSIFSGISKSGPGTLTLSNTNTYSAGTIVTGGTLEVAVLRDGFSPSSVGQSSNVANNLILDGATLRYIGAGDSTNRLFQMGQATPGAAITIDASGTGALVFSSPGSLTYGNTGQTRHLILGGLNPGDNLFAPTLANNGSGATTLTKEGAGKWIITGANSYAGGTVVANGTLELATSGGLGSGPVSLTGGSLHVRAGVAFANAVTFTSTASDLRLVRNASDSLVFGVESSLGDLDTTARVLDGVAADSRTIEAGFGIAPPASNDALRMSDVFSLTGTGTDVYVLQLGVELQLDAGSDIWLGSFEEESGVWVNAVLENSSNTATLEQQGFIGSFTAFQAMYGGMLGSYTGAHGLDPDANVVWAVLDHADHFAVVPEPHVGWVLLVGVALINGKRRRA